MRSADACAANIAVVQRFYTALSRHDRSALATLVTEDFVDHTQLLAAEGRRVGRAALLAHVAEVEQLLGPTQIVLEDVIAAGEKVVTRWALAVEDGGTPPAGRPAWQARVCGISIHRLRDGQIAERWVAVSV